MRSVSILPDWGLLAVSITTVKCACVHVAYTLVQACFPPNVHVCIQHSVLAMAQFRDPPDLGVSLSGYQFLPSAAQRD